MANFDRLPSGRAHGAKHDQEQKVIDRDFAEYGCEGVGEYSRCADMSDRFQKLLAEVEGAIMRLKMIRDDTTCPMNIAADIDQVLVEDLNVKED